MATPQLRNVVTMGVGFLLIMGGYAPCQNFATSLLNLPCLPVGSRVANSGGAGGPPGPSQGLATV